MNFNKAFVLGNVTRQPEMRALPSGQSVVNFGVATNRIYTDASGAKKQTTEFHNIVAFGKLADICAKYLNKGSLVLVEGRIQTRNWVNSTGQKQYRTEIIMENMQMGPRGARSGESSFAPSRETSKTDDIPVIEENYKPQPNIEAQDIPPKEVSGPEPETTGEEEINVKDIPF